MTVEEIRKELLEYGIEFKNSPVAVNVNSPWYYNGRTLQECYNNYSAAKYSAYNYCINLQATLNGKNGGVRGYNCMMFTYHFTFIFDNKNFYCVITKAHNYAYPIGEKICS